MILVATNETSVLHVLTARLESAGFAVAPCTDGTEVCDLARAIQPDVIIADFQMPHLSGPEVCARLFHDPLTREIPVVLLAAEGFAWSPFDRTANIRRIMPKPVVPGEILTIIERVLADQPVLQTSIA